MSLQVQRFKTVNEQHGFETGDRLLKSIAAALTEILGDGAVVARLSGDEFAIALGLNPAQLAEVDQVAEQVLFTATRPFTLDDRIIQVGAFAGIASTLAAEARVPDLLRRADIALDHGRKDR